MVTIVGQLSDWVAGTCFGAVLIVLVFVGAVVGLMFVPQWLAKTAAAPAKPPGRWNRCWEDRLVKRFPELAGLAHEERMRIYGECCAAARSTARRWAAAICSGLGLSAAFWFSSHFGLSGLGEFIAMFVGTFAGVKLAEWGQTEEIRRRIREPVGRC